VTDGDQTIIFSMNGKYDAPERPEPYDDDFAPVEERVTDFAPTLVSLGFIKAAIRRNVWIWCTTAMIGLFAALGLYAASPHEYQASTSLLLSLAPGEDVNTAAANNQVIAESHSVAALAVQALGLQQSAGSFLSTYSASPVTERVLVITISAPSGSQAVLRANAVAKAFLQFRAAELQEGQAAALESFQLQIAQTNKDIGSISAQIRRLSAQPPSSTQRSQLSSLRAEQAEANDTLNNLGQALLNEQTYTAPGTTAAAKDSVVLDTATLLPHSRLKPLLREAAIGLVVGLALGLAIVVVQALVSDRLRRRDDVAWAIGAPVKLSVGTVALKWWVPGRRSRSGVRGSDVRRIAAHLNRAVPGNSGRGTALAVVPVDDLRVPALSLVSLAVSCAEQGQRVVVADLCSGAPAAKLLGTRDPGVGTVAVYDTHLVVAVPEGGDIEPVGPLLPERSQPQRSRFTEEVATAYASADLLLTLITLDPSLGGKHLSTWATDAVAVVTAGRSSATRINAVGEMTRLSGTRLVSAVLVGADKTDESLGVVVDHDADLVEHRSHPDVANGLVATPVNTDYRRPHQT
jgi:capsular polysaccharide biosynthesis protein